MAELTFGCGTSQSAEKRQSQETRLWTWEAEKVGFCGCLGTKPVLILCVTSQSPRPGPPGVWLCVCVAWKQTLGVSVIRVSGYGRCALCTHLSAALPTELFVAGALGRALPLPLRILHCWSLASWRPSSPGARPCPWEQLALHFVPSLCIYSRQYTGSRGQARDVQAGGRRLPSPGPVLRPSESQGAPVRNQPLPLWAQLRSHHDTALKSQAPLWPGAVVSAPLEPLSLVWGAGEAAPSPHPPQQAAATHWALGPDVSGMEKGPDPAREDRPLLPFHQDVTCPRV